MKAQWLRAISVFLLLFSSIALGETVKVSHNFAEPKSTITLTRPDSVHFKSYNLGDELLLKFDRHVLVQDLQTLGTAGADWLDTVSTGYDSFFIKAKPNVRITIHTTGNKIDIGLTRQSTAKRAVNANIQARYRFADDNAWILLKKPNALHFNSYNLGDELTLKFDHDIVIKNISTLLKDGKRWINGISTGYGTLLIKAQPNVRMDVEANGNKIKVVFSPETQDVAWKVTNPEHLRLHLARARLYLTRGDRAQAVGLLENIGYNHENSSLALLARAQAEYALGRLHRALDLIEAGEAVAPDNTSFDKLRADIRKRYLGYARVNARFENTGKDVYERIVGVHSTIDLPDNHYAGFGAERNHFKIRNIFRTSNGLLTNVHDNKERGELFYGKHYDNGDWSKYSMYMAETFLGAGATYHHWDLHHSTDYQIAYHIPTWEFNEAVVDNGHRDMFGFQQTFYTSPAAVMQYGTSYNHYGVNGNHSAAESWRLNGTLGYLSPVYTVKDILGDNGSIGISYNLDMEYPFNVDNRIGLSGPYEPFPISKRQIHTVALSVAKQITEKLTVRGTGGFAKDKFAGSGFVYGGEAYLTPNEDIDIVMRLDRSLGIDSADQLSDIAEIDVRWRL